jgi:hypothetical protein
MATLSMPRMRPIAFALILTCAGCAAQPNAVATTGVPNDGLSRARIGETVAVGGPKVTPLEVLEDSRCPMNARCVWAGRVRVRARIDLGSGSQTRELTQGEPVSIADGTLELVEVLPDRLAGENARPIAPADYRFGLRFMGGF